MRRKITLTNVDQVEYNLDACESKSHTKSNSLQPPLLTDRSYTAAGYAYALQEEKRRRREDEIAKKNHANALLETFPCMEFPQKPTHITSERDRRYGGSDAILSSPSSLPTAELPTKEHMKGEDRKRKSFLGKNQDDF